MFRRLILLAALLAGLLAVVSGSSVSPATAQTGCSAAYPDFCIPPPPPDLNCPDLLPNVNFTALAADPHELDRDKDGIACEDASRPRFPTTTTTTTVVPVTNTVVVPPTNPTPALTTQTTMAGATATTSTTVATTATTVAPAAATTVRAATPAVPSTGSIALTG